MFSGWFKEEGEGCSTWECSFPGRGLLIASRIQWTLRNFQARQRLPPAVRRASDILSRASEGPLCHELHMPFYTLPENRTTTSSHHLINQTSMHPVNIHTSIQPNYRQPPRGKALLRNAFAKNALNPLINFKFQLEVIR